MPFSAFPLDVHYIFGVVFIYERCPDFLWFIVVEWGSREGFGVSGKRGEKVPGGDLRVVSLEDFELFTAIGVVGVVFREDVPNDELLEVLLDVVLV